MASSTTGAASWGAVLRAGSCAGGRARKHLPVTTGVHSLGSTRWLGGKRLWGSGAVAVEAGSRQQLHSAPGGRQGRRVQSIVAALAPMHRSNIESSDIFVPGLDDAKEPGFPLLPSRVNGGGSDHQVSKNMGAPPPVEVPYEDPQDLLWVMQPHHLSPKELWQQVQHEAKVNSIQEPSLASFLYSTILAHSSLEQAVAFILANKLSSPTLLNTQLMELFHETLLMSPSIIEHTRADMHAVFDRDPACSQYAQCLLYFKGFQALQAQRIAHYLWNTGRKPLSLALQSRVSEVFHVDIHPGARIGKGILLDHATGVVIGETAVVGDNCSLLHHVTLGGSGTEDGDRHPKLGNGVLVGAGVSVLGNIQVGTGAKIGAGSVVLREVPQHAVAVGVPSRVVKQLKKSAEPALEMDQISGYCNEGFGI